MSQSITELLMSLFFIPARHELQTLRSCSPTISCTTISTDVDITCGGRPFNQFHHVFRTEIPWLMNHSVVPL